MKGIELSKSFFENVGRQIIERSSLKALQQASIGCIGEGSERYGFDDQHSQDRCFGPFFQVFLFEQNDHLYNSILDALTNNLPKTFEGFEIKTQKIGDRLPNFEVWFWPDFTEHIVGLRRRPSDTLAYAKVPEAQFFALLSGHIIWDPNCDLQRAQLQWDHMPQEVWHWRLYWTLKNLSQRGCIKRALSHGETEMAKLLFPRYVEWTLRFSFLVARKYSPYRPWMLRVHKSLIGMKPVHEHIIAALNAQTVEDGAAHLENAINEVRQRMIEKKMIPESFTGYENKKEPFNANLYAEYFLSSISSDFRNQAERICPIDLVGSLEQRARNAP